jgi:hypothetical protein
MGVDQGIHSKMAAAVHPGNADEFEHRRHSVAS